MVDRHTDEKGDEKCRVCFLTPSPEPLVEHGKRATNEPLSMQIRADTESRDVKSRFEIRVNPFKDGGLIGLQLRTGRRR